jgi:hypothetical protein
MTQCHTESLELVTVQRSQAALLEVVEEKRGSHNDADAHSVLVPGKRKALWGNRARFTKIVARLNSNKIFFFLRHVIKLAKARTLAGFLLRDSNSGMGGGGPRSVETSSTGKIAARR